MQGNLLLSQQLIGGDTAYKSFDLESTSLQPQIDIITGSYIPTLLLRMCSSIATV